jgi:2-C-methyl-D-erythritol 2,4-cyclodiphosphate synthase
MILGGAEIPCDFGPDGHSDADVALHALIDALLGAMALGDIGKMFPDTDERYRGISSLELLRSVAREMCDRGYALGNADITIVLQRPRLAEYIEQMRKNIAEVLGAEVDDVSVKATTEEKMGFTGSGEGVSAYAVALIER